MAGSSIVSEASEDFRLLTITSLSESTPRMVAFKVNTREERNALITALRYFVDIIIIFYNNYEF